MFKTKAVDLLKNKNNQIYIILNKFNIVTSMKVTGEAFSY